jgi:hypothetical protein
MAIVFPQSGGFDDFTPMLEIVNGKPREEFDLLPKNISRQIPPDYKWEGTSVFNCRILDCDKDFIDVRGHVEGWEKTDLVAFYKSKFPTAFELVQDLGLENVLVQRLNVGMSRRDTNIRASDVRNEGWNRQS